MSGSRIDTSYQPWVTFYSEPSVNGQQPVASFAKQLAAQLQTLVGEASPSLRTPGVLRYPLRGMLRPAMPSGREY